MSTAPTQQFDTDSVPIGYTLRASQVETILRGLASLPAGEVADLFVQFRDHARKTVADAQSLALTPAAAPAPAAAPPEGAQ